MVTAVSLKKGEWEGEEGDRGSFSAAFRGERGLGQALVRAVYWRGGCGVGWSAADGGGDAIDRRRRTELSPRQPHVHFPDGEYRTERHSLFRTSACRKK